MYLPYFLPFTTLKPLERNYYSIQPGPWSLVDTVCIWNMESTAKEQLAGWKKTVTTALPDSIVTTALNLREVLEDRRE